MSYTTKDHILNMGKFVGAGLLGGPLAAVYVWTDTAKQMLEAEKAEERQREAEQRQREAEQRLRKAQEEQRKAQEEQRKAQEKQRKAQEEQRKAQEEVVRQREIMRKLQEAYEIFDRTRTNNENEAWNNLYLRFNEIDIEKINKHTIGVVGTTCAGKTTFLNKGFNLNLITSPIENTTGMEKVYENDNYKVIDIEGCNDNKKYESPLNYRNLKTCHEFIIIYDTSIVSNIRLIKLFLTMNAKLHIVRNKVDSMSDEEKEIIKQNDKNAIQNIINEMNELGVNQSINLDENYYMVSARENINVNTVVENLKK